MKGFLILSLLIQGLIASGQEKLILFTGNFDQAIDSAKKVDMDILLITKSLSCQVFESFKKRLINDNESIEFLNTSLIVFEYDMDNATDNVKKKMKKYYHSWRGFPQLYFIDKNEKLISDLTYPLSIEQKQQLEIWKNYRNIEQDWKRIKCVRKRRTIDYNGLIEFITYRQIKHSSFDLIQIKKVLNKYFRNIDSTQYFSNKNWNLINKYITIYSNPQVFDLVAKYKSDFQKNFGDSVISNYLIENYQRYIYWRKPKVVDKMAKKYPYHSVPEAIQAIDIYRKNNIMRSFIDYSSN